MQNKKLIRFVESFVLIPLTTVSLPFGGFGTANLDMTKSSVNNYNTPQIVLSQKFNTELSYVDTSNQVSDLEALTIEAKANAIDAYFKDKNMPLLGYGKKMVEEAIKNDLDWRLLPAISVIETTGGKNLCKRLGEDFNKNPFGWGSCKIGFKTFDSAIETVARNLGGNNPKTAHHYDGKNTLEIINKYNPPSIVPDYASKVMKVMDTIGEKDLGLTLVLNS